MQKLVKGLHADPSFDRHHVEKAASLQRVRCPRVVRPGRTATGRIVCCRRELFDASRGHPLQVELHQQRRHLRHRRGEPTGLPRQPVQLVLHRRQPDLRRPAADHPELQHHRLSRHHHAVHRRPPGTAAQEAAREQVNTYLLDNYPGGLIDFAAAVSTDGTATSSTVKAADLSDDNPSDAYYADLAARYVDDVDSGALVHPPN
ncbi:hypothetical protein [Streptomyces sp. NPDC059466]|uniref:hypothetical protein n=1 Tax=unclassified Streptomyces TaxID=2593676 RepID=UPI00367F5666